MGPDMYFYTDLRGLWGIVCGAHQPEPSLAGSCRCVAAYRELRWPMGNRSRLSFTCHRLNKVSGHIHVVGTPMLYQHLPFLFQAN